MSRDKSLSPIQQSISPTEVGTNKISKPFYSWLNEIYGLLGFKNCRNKDFEANITGITGEAITKVGYYNTFRNLIHFSCTIESSDPFVLSNAEINIKDFNDKVTPLIHGSCFTYDSDGTLVGTTLVENGIAKLPDITTTKVYINGFYQIKETN